MLEQLGISTEDWEQTPAATRAALTLLWQQNCMLQTRCAVYEQQIQRLTAEVEGLKRLELEVAELRERLGQSSRNSSKPPSADPPNTPRPPAKPASGRKRGAQKGHRGSTRQLLPTAQVDQVIDLRPVGCVHCGQLLLGSDPQPVRRQISELPRVQAIVTEYRQHRLTCLACGAVNTADWPADLPTGSFGPRVQAVVGYLTGRLNLSHRDAVEALQSLHGLPLSLGSVAALQRQVSAALGVVVETAQTFVKQQATHCVDETSWREQAQRTWLWVNATPQVTAFHLLAGRGQRQAQTVLGPRVTGTITSDRYSAYQWVPARQRQLCWAHLKRDFQAISERAGDSAQLGQALLSQTRALFTIWHRYRDGTLTWAQCQRQMKPVKAAVGKLLRAGVKADHARTRKTCQQLRDWEEALWTFVRVPGLEPTNNQAERSLRRAVLWRKRSFGTQSERGSRFVERILTVITTLRQQGRDVLDFLTAACQNALGQQHALCLLPVSH